jgi:nitroreductase
MQRWRFLIIRDPKTKETVRAYYKRAWDEQVAPRYRSGEPAPGMDRDRFLRLLDAEEYLAAHIHEAPVGKAFHSASSCLPLMRAVCSSAFEATAISPSLTAVGVSRHSVIPSLPIM